MFKKGQVAWNKGNGEYMKGEKNPFYGKTHSQESKEKQRRAKLGKKATEEQKKKASENSPRYWLGKKRAPFSMSTRLKMSESHTGIHKGDKHPNWKGGVSSMNMRIRNTMEYRMWREAVFVRDNWTCTWCSARSGKGIKVILNADHIKSFADFPELRFSVDNGRTLCVPCHKKTDNFGWKAHNLKK